MSIWWEGRKSTFWASLKTCSNPTEFAANWYTVRSIHKCTAAFRITKFGAVCAILRHSRNRVFCKSSKLAFLGQFWETAIPLSKRLVSTCIVFIGLYCACTRVLGIFEKMTQSRYFGQNKLAQQQAFGCKKGTFTLFFQLFAWWAARGKQCPNNTILNSNLHLEAWKRLGWRSLRFDPFLWAYGRKAKNRLFEPL